MSELRPGDAAPELGLADGEGKTWRLDALRGRRVILYFYPADDTPGCTTQACDFRDAHAGLTRDGYVVLGVSPQDARSHQAFARKHALNFPLLVDDELRVATAYGVVRPEPGVWRSDDGSEVPLEVRRSTFVIDEEGRIAHALYDVRARGHVATLRDLL